MLVREDGALAAKYSILRQQTPLNQETPLGKQEQHKNSILSQDYRVPPSGYDKAHAVEGLYLSTVGFLAFPFKSTPLCTLYLLFLFIVHCKSSTEVTNTAVAPQEYCCYPEIFY